MTSVLAAVFLQYIDPFGTSKLVLFQVALARHIKFYLSIVYQITKSNDSWRFFELVPWGILGVIGVGSAITHLFCSALLVSGCAWSSSHQT